MVELNYVEGNYFTNCLKKKKAKNTIIHYFTNSLLFSLCANLLFQVAMLMNSKV